MVNATRLTTDEVRTALHKDGVKIRLTGEGTWKTAPQPIEGGPVLARRVGEFEDIDEARVFAWDELAEWLETLTWREQVQA